MRSFLFLLFFIVPFSAKAQLNLAVESGFVFSQYNDVRVPNGADVQGTLFSLDEDFTPQQGGPFIRLELSYLLNNKHIFELTAAPLVIEYSNARLNRIDFAGTVFSGNNTNGRYEFNTYRASYRYRFVNNPKFIFDLGASILVRDARIALSQGELEAEDTDLGFVPLLSFHLNYLASPQFSLLLKGDALVGPQGRAEDIFAGILYEITEDRLRLKVGYRLIEGGADVEQVYNFAFVHFADVGFLYTFN